MSTPTWRRAMLQIRSLVAGAALLAAALLPSAAQAAFPGTNAKIAFVSGRDGNFEIYAMYADGSGQTRITNDPASDDNPAWSPDGQQIAFGSNRGGAPDVYVMTAGGASPTPLTSASASSFNDAPVEVRNGASVLQRLVTRRRAVTFKGTPAGAGLVVTVRALGNAVPAGPLTTLRPKAAAPRGGG